MGCVLVYGIAVPVYGMCVLVNGIAVLVYEIPVPFCGLGDRAFDVAT